MTKYSATLHHTSMDRSIIYTVIQSGVNPTSHLLHIQSGYVL